MKNIKEIIGDGLIFLLISFIFFLTLRFRIGAFYEQILIDPAGLLQQLPWLSFSAEQFKKGFFPLWNPYIGFGQPHLANLQTAVFYPLNIIIYLLGNHIGYEIWLWLRLFVGGFFIYLFLRKLNFERLACFAGASVWALGGYGLWFIQLVDLNSQILFPLFLIFLDELAKKSLKRHFLGVIIIGLFIIFGGHPEAVFNCFLFGGIFFLFQVFQSKRTSSERLKTTCLLMLSYICSFVLTGVVLLPFINYYTRSWSLHYPGFGLFHLDIKTISSIALPYFTPYSRGAGRIMVELLGQGVLSIFKQGYLKTTAPGVMPGVGIIAFFLAIFCICQLRKLRSEVSFFAGLMTILLGLTYGIAPFHWLALFPVFNQLSNYKFYFSEITFCLAVLAGAGLNLILRRKRKLGMLFFGLLLASLYIYVFQIKPYIDLKIKGLERKAWIKEMAQSSPNVPVRISGVDEPYPLLPPNLASLFGINDIRSSDALFPKDYFALMDELNGIDISQRLEYFYPEYYIRPLKSALNNPLLDIFGVKWIIARENIWKNQLPDKFLSKKINEGYLLENLKNFPRVFICHNLDFEKVDNCLLKKARILKYSATEISILVHATEFSYLILTDLYYPGWRAEVDGKEVRVIKAGLGFRAMPVGQGTHKIDFVFSPVDFKIGLVLTLSGFIMIFAVLALRKNVKKI